MYSVLCCGSNGNYQLGVEDDDDHDTLVVAKFRRDDGDLVDFLDSRPINIVCGGNHTFILLESGALFACGDNTYGQCALGTNAGDHVVNFHQVSGEWRLIAAGWEFSILVGKNGSMYSCGLGQKGELGQGPETVKCEALQEMVVDFECSDIVDIKASLNHCIVKLTSGELYGWGNSRKGQLGEIKEVTSKGKPAPIIWAPKKLDFGLNLPVVDYGLGRDLTSILDTTNTITVFGKLHETIQGEGQILNLKSMWSSIHYSYKTDLVRIKSFGNNSHGQLFPNQAADPNKNRTTDPIIDFQIGSEHGLVLTDKNAVFAWGWGEHGNCGIHEKIVSSSIDDQVTFDYLNPFYFEGKVALLGCGCATSWIVIEN